MEELEDWRSCRIGGLEDWRSWRSSRIGGLEELEVGGVGGLEELHEPMCSFGGLEEL